MAMARESFQRGVRLVYPPETRLIRAGHSVFCPTCERFVRNPSGGCPGVASQSRDTAPVCHQSGPADRNATQQPHAARGTDFTDAMAMDGHTGADCE